jgi:hypothetical protein
LRDIPILTSLIDSTFSCILALLKLPMSALMYNNPIQYLRAIPERQGEPAEPQVEGRIETRNPVPERGGELAEPQAEGPLNMILGLNIA